MKTQMKKMLNTGVLGKNNGHQIVNKAQNLPAVSRNGGEY
jgi:hypothetical protein